MENKVQCPNCSRLASALERCDFCGNDFCHVCEPSLSSDVAQLCSSCVRLRDTLRAGESTRTRQLRLMLEQLPLPQKPERITRSWRLRVVITQLVNLARRDMATPGLDAKTDRLWRKAVRILKGYK